MGVLRALRDLVATVLFWGTAWALGAVAVPVIMSVSATLRPVNGEAVRLAATYYGIAGIESGIVFSILIAVASRRRSFADLRPDAVATYGAVAGASHVLFFGLTLVLNDARVPSSVHREFPVILAVIGAVTALSLLSRARWRTNGAITGAASRGSCSSGSTT
jgi:hypothetical protein